LSKTTSSLGTLVFDLDGTLVDSIRDLVPALNHATASVGLPPIAEEDVGHIVGQGAMVMIARAFAFHEAELDDETHKRLLSLFLEHYEEHIADKTVFFDGCWDALDELAAKGWALCVCTNKYEHLARKLLGIIDSAERFPVITGGDTFAQKKPAPSHILQTIKLAGGSPQRAIMVGDSINDIAAAQAANVPSIAVDFGYTDIPVSELGADIIISHFNAFPAAVETITSRWSS